VAKTPAATPKPTTTAPVTTAAPSATPAPSTSAAPSTPALSPTQSTLAHTPAKSIGAAINSAAAHDENTVTANAMLGTDTPTASAPKPTKLPAQVETTTTEIAPGVTATSTDVEAAPQASPAFRAFIANLRITGFVAGASPKALINGRLVRVGESVDSTLGITFAGVKDDQLLFKDKTGASVTRRY
jgi:hypothetical protein